jgi:O-6-methylguanine DNA methyltransferase
MTDRLDEMLAAYFDPRACPSSPGGAPLLARVRRHAARTRDGRALVDRLRIVATGRGIARIALGHGAAARGGGGGGLVERARRELAEYLQGERAFFSVPVDLRAVPEFQARVLAAAARIPFGETRSYAGLAREIGHPAAARAVGNALGANPVPILVPCHRVIRGDGTWGHYAFGAALKTRLLTLERTTPVLVGCTSTRIVCRRGCAHEQRQGEDRRVAFASVADARSVGYRPCLACRPR